MSFQTKQMILNKENNSVEIVGTEEECQLKLEEIKRLLSSVTQLEAVTCSDQLMRRLKKLSDSYVIVDMPTDTVEESIAIFLNREKESLIAEIKKSLISHLDESDTFDSKYLESCADKFFVLLPGNSLVKDFIYNFQYILYYNNDPKEIKDLLESYITKLAKSTSYE